MGTIHRDHGSYRHDSSAVLQAFSVRSSDFGSRGQHGRLGAEHEIHDRKVRPLSMDKRTKTAVLLDNHPLWLDAVERVLTRIDIDVLGKSSDTTGADAPCG